MSYYECSICYELNHAARLHCQHCGSVPACYSILGRPARLIEHETWTQFISVVRAHGAESASQHRAVKVYFRTVPATYYAEDIGEKHGTPNQNI